MQAADIRCDNDLAFYEKLKEHRDVVRVNDQIARHEAEGPSGIRRSLLATSVRLTSAMAPAITAMAQECVEKLGIALELELYVYSSPQFNAACFKPDDGRLYVMFSSSLLEGFTPPELKFVIGHELGHLVVVHGLAHLHGDLVEAVDHALHVGHRGLHVAAHVHGPVQLRLLGQESHAHALGGARLASEILVDAGHDAQERTLTRAVEPDDADLGAGVERQPDPAEDLPSGGHGLTQVLHREYVLGGHRGFSVVGSGRALRLRSRSLLLRTV